MIGRLPALCCGVVVGGRVARRVGGVVTVRDVRIVHRACLQTTMKEIKKSKQNVLHALLFRVAQLYLWQHDEDSGKDLAVRCRHTTGIIAIAQCITTHTQPRIRRLCLCSLIAVVSRIVRRFVSIRL